MAGRRSSTHEPPLWIDPSKETYFITVNCQERGVNKLCEATASERIFESVRHRNATGIWFVRIFLLMPDHAHSLISFPPEKRMSDIIRDWKRWTSRLCDITWQRGWFDHRLRSDESEREKADYILNNPVRAGLIEDKEKWPWVWMPER